MTSCVFLGLALLALALQEVVSDATLYEHVKSEATLPTDAEDPDEAARGVAGGRGTRLCWCGGGLGCCSL